MLGVPPVPALPIGAVERRDQVVQRGRGAGESARLCDYVDFMVMADFKHAPFRMKRTFWLMAAIIFFDVAIRTLFRLITLCRTLTT
jgi:hypothetical protein